MLCVVLHGHPTGQIFRVASSSRSGLLHVSLSTGRGDFYVWSANGGYGSGDARGKIRLDAVTLN